MSARGQQQPRGRVHGPVLFAAQLAREEPLRVAVAVHRPRHTAPAQEREVLHRCRISGGRPPAAEGVRSRSGDVRAVLREVVDRAADFAGTPLDVFALGVLGARAGQVPAPA